MEVTTALDPYRNEKDIRHTLARRICTLVLDSEQARAIAQVNNGIRGGWLCYPDDCANNLLENGRQEAFEYLRDKDAFVTGEANPYWFDRVQSPNPAEAVTKVVPFSFKQKGAGSAAQALNIFKTTHSIIGPQTPYQIALYDTLLLHLGREKFDTIFDPLGLYALTFGGNKEVPPPLSYFLTNVPPQTKVKLGDIVTFQGCEFYRSKHLFGIAEKYFTICVEDSGKLDAQRFTTLGLPPKGVTRDEMCGTMIKDFNAEPQTDVLASQKTLEKIEAMDPGILFRTSIMGGRTLTSIEGLKCRGGGKMLSHQRVNFELINTLASAASAEEALAIFHQHSTIGLSAAADPSSAEAASS